MRKLILFVAAILAVSVVFGQTKSDLEFIEQTLEDRGEIVLQFPHNGNRDLIYELGHIVSIDKINDTCVQAYANRNEYEQFKTYGLEYAPVYEYYHRTRALNMATTVAQMANWDRYPTYSVYLQMMQNYAATYPDLCRLVTNGQSVNGRDIVTLVISDNVNVDEDEPEFWWSSTMHGDETTGWYFMLRLIDYLLTNYGTDEQVTRLVNNIEIHITPNTNPDGTFYRSNDGTSMANGRRYNQNGVDLNRNFPFINGTASQGNQPEITMMTAYADAHNFVMSANGHGGDECLNYPWDENNWTHARRPNADDDWWEYVCWQYANTVHAINSRILTGPSDVSGANGVTKGSEWYSIDGGRQDYMNYYHHCKEITMEWSSTKMLGTENLNTYWNYHRQAILDYTEQVLYGFNGIVTDACSGNPLGGVHVFINNHDTDNTDVYTSNGVGDYHRPIYGGTYSVTFSKEGYTSQTINVTTQTGTATRLDVALYPENTLTPNFVANNVVVFEGDAVNFSNTTNGNYSAQTWTFEGGTPSTSNATSPAVTYPTQGTYDVTLSLVSQEGCIVTTTKENYITVYAHAAPQANFEANQTTVNEGSVVTFTDLSTNVPTSWNWTFEGGTPSTSTVQNPQITYNTAGTYEVTLTASNAYGVATETKTAYITVVSEINMSNADIYACGGTYKDPAGDGNYSNNTNITQTIYPASEGSYVVLTFSELGIQNPTTSQWGGQTTYNDYIKIYDGTSTSATLIGQYAGSDPTAIGTNGVVTATNNAGALTIQFYSNYTTVGSGWVAEISCYSPEPEAEFSARITDACSGSIATTNTSNYATSYLWNFGDGATSTDEAPTHTYTTSGTYTITLTATNANGNSTATQTVEISIPEITATTPANGCSGTSMTLAANGNGTLHWFDAATNGNELGTGTTYTASFEETTTVYVESQISNLQSYSIGYADNSTSTAYTQNNNTARGLNFTVSAPLTLVSVDVYCSQANTTKTITIQNTSTNANVYSQSHTLATGKNTLTLNLELAAGTYRIYANNCRYLYRITTTNFSSFVIDGVMSITGAYNGNGYYYAFYNMQIQTGSLCSSERVAVTATVAESGSIDLGEPIVQCGGTATIDAGNGFTSYLWNNNATTQSITVNQSGTYTVTATSGECQATASKIVTINPVPSVTITTGNATLTANATNGTAPYSYSWNNDAETANTTASASGEYCVTITDANNCNANACTNFTLPTFDITLTEAENGTINGDESAEYGSNYTFTVIPANCYEIAEVRVDGNIVTLNANNQYTIENVTSAHTVSATFSQITYTITTNAGNGGSITAATTATCGETFTFTVNANECYQIDDVTVNGISVNLSGNTYTINNVSANQTINATFTPITYDVTTNAGNGGTINAAANATCGETFTFTVTPNSCYEIASVTVNGNIVNANNNVYSVENVTSDLVINATFSQITYNVTATAGNGGTINAPATATCGQDLTFAINADACYEIDNVTVNGVSVNVTNSTYTISNVTSDMVINATFAQLSYNITATAGNGGSISDAGTTSVLCGNNKTYTISANDGYMISDVLVNGSSVGSVTSYTFNNVTADGTIEARFEEIPANEIVITINADPEGGEVSPTGTQTVEEGNDFTFTVTPDDCYEIGTVSVNGTTVSLEADNSYTIHNVTTEQEINVTFNRLAYIVTATASNGGTINVPATATCGQDLTFAINADDCYEIDNVTVNGISVNLTNNTYTISNVTSDIIINATFRQLSYTITASASEGGSITPEGEVAVACGTDKTFSISADSGFAISDVIVDGTSMGAITTYTFTNVAENGHTISASFIENIPECYAVTDFNVQIESYGVILSWTAAENAVSYDIYRNGERIASQQGTTTIDIEGHVGDTYYIITNCEHGTSDPSESITATEEAICNSVTNLDATIESYGIILSWTAAENAVSYDIYRNGERIASQINTNAVDLDGHEGDTYYIITNCEFGTSDPSESVTAQITDIIEVAMETTLFPNPANDILNISSTETISSVEFVSITGQVIFRINVNGETAVCNIKTLAPGMYFVRVYGNEGMFSQQKFIKE